MNLMGMHPGTHHQSKLGGSMFRLVAHQMRDMCLEMSNIRVYACVGCPIFASFNYSL
jgi:hypothetical protein